MAEPESSPFLTEMESAPFQLEEKPGLARPSIRSRIVQICAPFKFSIILLSLFFYTGVVIIAARSSSVTCVNERTWSPALEALEWENRHLGAYIQYGNYTGEPSQHVDASWNSLLQGMSIKILPEELKRIGTASLELRDGSGYMGSLAVFHELHCVKVLRQGLYKDFYWRNSTERELVLKHEHMEHCLEVIRLSTMCRGDISVIPSVWEYDNREGGSGALLGPSIRDGRALHRCVKWDRLQSWAKSRRLDLSDSTLLLPDSEYS
ncbi:hypothetical protein F5B22DRAFT_644816 [Xylaria bambusicola]|uniref:uncharacterized protein n=1 Tax=Xylaria bambusicola TaxID=326684 RepID=UPI0020080108|nr:uncharacterized protein F5B22DRAFT_644816 [Xylaria bambusicola]KAI0518511.1 hypothetical protein F5B22DRAFT_644816 [Xylaria bambusicola]